MNTVDDQTPGDGDGLSIEQVRAACDAYLAALDATDMWLAAYRAMVLRFRASGTLTPGDAERATLAALEPSPGAFARMDELDALRRGEPTPAEDPNAHPYMLTWTDTGEPYVSPYARRTTFTLGEAMRIADTEAVTVTDGETGRVAWVGGRAERGGM